MVSTPPQSGDPGILGAGGARHYWMLADADAADADGEGGGPSRGPRRAENVNYNGNRYFYHSDHLGSSSLITDASGNVTQQLDYLPYGEVFLEKRANVDYSTPYRFNGKELDEETGLYYYGARYMNPRLSIWYATDLLQEKYPEVSTYLYCHGNPICIYDKDGNDDVYINNNHQIIKVVQGSPNICVVMPNGKRVLFSNIEFGRTSWLPAGWNCGNRQIVANVFGYYAKKMGITNVGAEAKLGANNVLAFFSPQNNHIWLSPGHDGTMNNLLVNKYNLMNVAYHESLHDLDKKNQKKLNHLRHAQITLMASQHPLYMKCTQEYKIGEAAAFAQYVMNAYYEGSKNEALRLIDEYNNSNLGISFFFNEEKRRMEVVGTKHFVKYKKAKSPINL
jgi:RHS repeat-associated protein